MTKQIMVSDMVYDELSKIKKGSFSNTILSLIDKISMYEKITIDKTSIGDIIEDAIEKARHR